MDKLHKKYGFWTASAMVIGIVIGSGVFFKADDVLIASGGSLPTALTAWGIGGFLMIVTAYVFSVIAGKIEKVNGIVDYFEAAYGIKAGYYIAWFMTFIYYPSLTAVLAWVSANYTSALFNSESVWIISAIYLILFFLINLLSPIIAGRLQIGTTLVKLLPLVAVGVTGTVAGLINGQTIQSFTTTAATLSNRGGGLALATLSTAFAYEGWIIATTINSEIKDAKRNLPRALVTGTFVIVIVYMLYYNGIAGVIGNQQVIEYGDNTSLVVISTLFGSIAGTLLNVFVVISCLGTLNGLVMASSRGMHSIAVRDLGPKPEIFKKVNVKTDSAVNSGITGLILSSLWLIVWYGNFHGWFNGFIDISELPIAFLYLIYISLYIWMIREFKEENVLRRFIAPTGASVGSLYIISAAVQKDKFITFTIISLVIMATAKVVSIRRN